MFFSLMTGGEIWSQRFKS